MKLNFQQKFNAFMLTVFVLGAVAAGYFSKSQHRACSETYVNPITSTDSTCAVIIPEP